MTPKFYGSDAFFFFVNKQLLSVHIVEASLKSSPAEKTREGMMLMTRIGKKTARDNFMAAKIPFEQVRD